MYKNILIFQKYCYNVCKRRGGRCINAVSQNNLHGGSGNWSKVCWKLWRPAAMKIFTIMELCSWLDIPRKAFYRYFSSKEGALYALIDHTLMDFSVDFLAHDPAATYSTLEHFSPSGQHRAICWTRWNVMS